MTVSTFFIMFLLVVNIPFTSVKATTTNNNWITLDEVSNVPINKEFVVTFSGEVQNDKIDGIVIEKDNTYIPVEIKKLDTNKIKIFKIAKELNYVPNLNARSLVNKKSGLIGVIVVRDYKTEGPWKKNFYSSYINTLERLLNKQGYHLLITNAPSDKPNLNIILQRELEAVFVIDVDEKFFYKISNNFTVPIIILDSIIEDNLFCKILPNFEYTINKALEDINDKEAYLITEKFNSTKVMDSIINTFNKKKHNLYIMESKEGIKNFLKTRKDNKGIVISEYVALLAERYVDYKNLTVISTCGDSYFLPEDINLLEFNILNKAEKSVELMKELLEQKYRGNRYLILQAE